MVEVTCRWSKQFSSRQVQEILEATFPDIDADFWKAVAFRTGHGLDPLVTTLPSSSSNPPVASRTPSENPSGQYSTLGVFVSTALASADTLTAEDELLNLLGDWAETAGELDTFPYMDISPSAGKKPHVKDELVLWIEYNAIRRRLRVKLNISFFSQ